MSSSEQRSIDYLVTRYQMEPSLKDIYVEGAEDKRVVDAFLEEHGVSGVAVFEISSVDVPRDEREGVCNRTSVIRLARKLLTSLGPERSSVACIADSDFDHLSREIEQSAFLLMTDYANMEMYFFSPTVLARLNRDVSRDRGVTEDIWRTFMVPALQFLFRVRYVHSKLGLKIEVLPPTKLVLFADKRFVANKDRYLERYLGRGGGSARRAEFLSELEKVSIDPELDPRCFVHAHDSVALLRWMLGKLGGGRQPFHDDCVMLGVLRGCADYKALAQEPMFAEILQRFA